MLKKRWYDHDPTVSMAVSLLRNAPSDHQNVTSDYIMGLLGKDPILEPAAKESILNLSYLFPLGRRRHFTPPAIRLLETMKRLPHGLQLEMSFHMIHQLFVLDGVCPETPEAVKSLA